MSILKNLSRYQKAYQQQRGMASEDDLVSEYNALRRAYLAALASNNIESSLMWSDRAKEIAREMARMQDYTTETEEDELLSERKSA